MKSHKTYPLALLMVAMCLATVCGDEPNESADERVKLTPQQRRQLATAVNDAYVATHDGWSADEVVINDELNKKFVESCRRQMPDVDEFEFNWTLMNLRKAGKLGGETTRRQNASHDEHMHAAEIAARYCHDKHGLTIDRVLCDPPRRAEFDQLAASISPDTSAYLLRKAALGLRKKRDLKPELIVRIADWGRDIYSLPADQIVKKPELVPQEPGIYIFRDESGYLYIGESINLRSRVSQHLDHSDRKSLAHYLWQTGVEKVTVELHAFDADSKAKETTVRRAYESELIRSREPQFNIRP